MTEAELEKVKQYEFFVQKHIAELRKRLGLKSGEMSYLVDQSRNFVSNVENGLSAPSMHGFFCMCVVLDESPKTFFGAMVDESDEEEPDVIEMLSAYKDLDVEDRQDILKMTKRYKKSK